MSFLHNVLLVGILAFNLLHCGGSEDYKDLAIEDEFLPDEVELIEAAIDEWVIATDSGAAIIFTRTGYESHHEFNYYDDWAHGPDFPILYKIYTKEQGYTAMYVSRGEHFCGIARADIRVGLVGDCTDDNPEHFYQLILHELGHFYGLNHSLAGLMRETVAWGCIDQFTVDAFCIENECGPWAGTTC